MDWYRTPVDKAAGWYFHKRVLSSYVTRLQNDSKPITVLSAQPDATYNTFVFFSGNYDNSSDIKQINQSFKDQTYTYKNITFTGDCTKISTQSASIVISETGFDCLPNKKYIQIANPRDNGVMYKIFSDQMCENYNKNKYPHPQNLSDFSVEKMTDQQFCEQWITDPSSQ
jgi:hypothetical protein